MDDLIPEDDTPAGSLPAQTSTAGALSMLRQHIPTPGGALVTLHMSPATKRAVAAAAPRALAELDRLLRPAGTAVVADCVNLAFETLGHDHPSADGLVGFFEALSDYPADMLREATRRLIQASHYRPTPSDWIRRMPDAWTDLNYQRRMIQELWHRINFRAPMPDKMPAAQADWEFNRVRVVLAGGPDPGPYQPGIQA